MAWPTRPKTARVFRGVVILVLALRLVEQLLVVLEALRGGPPHNRRDRACTSGTKAEPSNRAQPPGRSWAGPVADRGSVRHCVGINFAR